METATKVATQTEVLLPTEVDQFPLMVTEQVKKKGDLIDAASFSSEQIAKVKDIVSGFNFSETMKILTFAAAPQLKMSAFLDELLAGIKVKEAGAVGEIAMQMAKGIDLMQLHKVKDQIANPPSTNVLARFFRWVRGWVNYVEAFYLAQQPVRDLIDTIQRKANNRMVGLDGQSKKLDLLAVKSAEQVRELELWIAAGEIILLGGIRQYQEERERVLQSKDPIKA